MEVELGLKEFLYRSSLSVIAKSPLNFGAMFSIFYINDFDISLENDLVKEMLKAPGFIAKQETQMDKIRSKNIIRVAIVKDKAYFVHDNTFYTASIVDGEVDRSSASPVNAIDMSKKEIDHLLSILDNMNS